MRTFNTSIGRVAIITDTHFGARADSMVFHDYFMRFYEEILFPYLIEHNVKYLLHLGDFTDRRKYINFLTLNKIRKYFRARLKELNIQLICTIGNHDTFFKNTNEVNSMEELFSDDPDFIILTEAEEVMFDDVKVLLVPWINDSNYEKSMELIKNTDAKILMGHLEIKGFLMQRGQKSEHGFDADLFSKFDMVCSGHYHHKSSDGNIHYLGSPYEMTFADVNDPRGFHMWTVTESTCEFIQNPNKMFHRLYYNDKEKKLASLLRKVTAEKYAGTHVKVIVEHRTNPYYFEQFMEKLFALNPVDVKIEEDLKVDDSTDDIVDMAEDTMTILNKYVDGLDIETDKTRLKEEVRSLWVEANSMER